MGLALALLRWVCRCAVTVCPPPEGLEDTGTGAGANAVPAPREVTGDSPSVPSRLTLSAFPDLLRPPRRHRRPPGAPSQGDCPAAQAHHHLQTSSEGKTRLLRSLCGRQRRSVQLLAGAVAAAQPCSSSQRLSGSNRRYSSTTALPVGAAERGAEKGKQQNAHTQVAPAHNSDPMGVSCSLLLLLHQDWFLSMRSPGERFCSIRGRNAK